MLGSKIKSEMSAFEQIKKSIEKTNILYKINRNRLDIENKMNLSNKRVINTLNEQKINLEELKIKLLESKLFKKIENLDIEKDDILLSIKNNMNNSINYKKKGLNLINDINNLYMAKVNKYNNELLKINLETKVSYLYRNIQDKILICSKIDNSISDMSKNILNNRQSQLSNLSEDIYNLGPERTLVRGYSIIIDNNGSILNRRKYLVNGESYNINFSDGEVKVHIKIIEKGSVNKK